MSSNTLFLIVSTFIFLYLLTTKLIRRKSGSVVRLPPGPYPLPIIGNIFQLGKNPHILLTSLSKTYGGLMTLKLGSTITVVVSSPEFAKEVFQKHDLSFSSRWVPDTGQAANNHLFSVIWLPVGDQWRKLRKLSKEHLFSVQQLDAGQLLRREKIRELLDYVHECFMSRKPINIGHAAFTTSLNVLSSFIFSTDMARYDSLESQEFKDTISSLADVVAKPNLADFFPLLKPFDPQGLLREANVYVGKLMAILDRMVDNVIIKESDIGKLPYLEAVIKETFRLHPPAPLLLPHKALCDVEIGGFVVPKDAQILCNVWAIGRDPTIWSNPHEFMPERFLDVDIDYKGRDFELIPFGSGRRICPGLPLAHRMLHLMLAALIRKFDWEPEGETRPGDMDMSERFGVTLHKNVPLVATPIEI